MPSKVLRHSWSRYAAGDTSLARRGHDDAIAGAIPVPLERSTSEERQVTSGEDTAAERAVPEGSAPSADAQRRRVALDELAGRPLGEHPDGYERLHAELRAALAEIDDA
jgi:hypothetical protein